MNSYKQEDFKAIIKGSEFEFPFQQFELWNLNKITFKLTEDPPKCGVMTSRRNKCLEAITRKDQYLKHLEKKHKEKFSALVNKYLHCFGFHQLHANYFFFLQMDPRASSISAPTRFPRSINGN